VQGAIVKEMERSHAGIKVKQSKKKKEKTKMGIVIEAGMKYADVSADLIADLQPQQHAIESVYTGAGVVVAQLTPYVEVVMHLLGL
jgi:hypothetical protein